MFFTGGDYGTIYTPDLARYVAIAATSLPDSELSSSVDVGWSEPVNGEKLAAASGKILSRPVAARPVVPSFVVKAFAPIIAAFNSNMRDMLEMVRWVNAGIYVSKNTERQKKLFDDLPTIEEAVRRYCRDNEEMHWYFPALDPDLGKALEAYRIVSGTFLDIGTGPGTQAIELA